MEIKNQIEVKTLEHNGIKVNYKVDYITKKASLIDFVDNEFATKFTNKSWVFVDRGLQYMDGWLNILEAMKMAVIQCKKALEEREKEEEREEAEMIIKKEKLNKKK